MSISVISMLSRALLPFSLHFMGGLILLNLTLQYILTVDENEDNVHVGTSLTTPGGRPSPSEKSL